VPLPFLRVCHDRQLGVAALHQRQVLEVLRDGGGVEGSAVVLKLKKKELTTLLLPLSRIISSKRSTKINNSFFLPKLHSFENLRLPIKLTFYFELLCFKSIKYYGSSPDTFKLLLRLFLKMTKIRTSSLRKNNMYGIRFLNLHNQEN
jgi:hypothetical protein